MAPAATAFRAYLEIADGRRKRIYPRGTKSTCFRSRRAAELALGRHARYLTGDGRGHIYEVSHETGEDLAWYTMAL